MSESIKQVLYTNISLKTIKFFYNEVKKLKIFVNYVDINFNSINIMINYFALTVTEMGIGKIELAVIGVVILIFPILFVYASKNLDAKGVFEWMMEKPNDWIGKK